MTSIINIKKNLIFKYPEILTTILIIGIALTITFIYIKNELNKGKKSNKIPPYMFPEKNKHLEVNESEEIKTFDIKNNQSIEIDKSSRLIKKIIRTYKNINSLEINNTNQDILDDFQKNELSNFDIKGSAFETEEDELIQIESLFDNPENYPDLKELSLIKEVDTHSEPELFKIIDSNLHQKVTDHLERMVSGEEDDDLLNEFQRFKIENSYAENTYNLFHEIDSKNSTI